MRYKRINVTSPLLPPLKEFIPYLEDIWESKWLANCGNYHKKLEKALTEYLNIEHISLFTNGTLPLVTALQSMRISGEVITTPYSFPATAHSLVWNGIEPIFVDVDEWGNVNPDCIERAITPKTQAILAVHVYGNPCNTQKIKEIADKYGLKLIYDAAHCFGVEINGKSILEHGDISTLSFHATKLFNTFEGGALICRDKATKERIDYLKNFGFAGETEIIMPGINGKIDEIRCAYGLLNLKYVDKAIANRKRCAMKYREKLADVKGISFFSDMDGVKHNYSYFPIFIDKAKYGMSRDELYEKLKKHNIFARRYFYPLISDFVPYRNLKSAEHENLPNAAKMAEQVICLPIYADLEVEDVERVAGAIQGNKK
jgi:dTDP-4-amino-4,6-dideoxygalactose transaminase